MRDATRREMWYHAVMRTATPKGEALRELWAFIWKSKNWLIAPILLILLLLSALVLLSSTGAAPLMYTLF
jgi:hypothetical protein